MNEDQSLERPGYFRQSLRDAVALPPQRGRPIIAHCFNGGHNNYDAMNEAEIRAELIDPAQAQIPEQKLTEVC
jgi:deoxyribodipyrimidine photolyase-like uncharacterized protein